MKYGSRCVTDASAASVTPSPPKQAFLFIIFIFVISQGRDTLSVIVSFVVTKNCRHAAADSAYGATPAYFVVHRFTHSGVLSIPCIPLPIQSAEFFYLFRNWCSSIPCQVKLLLNDAQDQTPSSARRQVFRSEK